MSWLLYGIFLMLAYPIAFRYWFFRNTGFNRHVVFSLFLLASVCQGCRPYIQNPVEVEGNITCVVIREADRCILTVEYMKNQSSQPSVGLYSSDDFNSVTFQVEQDNVAGKFSEGQTVRIRYEEDHPEKAELVDE